MVSSWSTGSSRNLWPSVVVLVLACACTSAEHSSHPVPVQPTPAEETVSQELDLMESVFRHHLELHTSASRMQPVYDYVFLSLEKGRDPPPELLARFAGNIPPIEPVSCADNGWYGVRHREKGGTCIVLQLTRIHWLDGSTAEVEAGWRRANRSAGGATYRVERRDGTWTIVSRLNVWAS